MSLSAPAPADSPANILAYLDVVVVAVATPIMLLIGVPAVGYLVALGVWIVLRAAGVAVERVAAGVADPRQAITIRLSYLLGRLFALAIAIILVRNASGRDAGLTTLLVIVFAFTLQLILSFLNRPRSA